MKKPIPFILGPMLFVLLWLTNPFALQSTAACVIGVVAWMLSWWISECVPMAVTSLLPIILFPLTGVMSVEKTCVAYGNRFVFLFLGGFIIALAMEKWNLHRRLALTIVNLTGTSANKIIFGFFLSSYLISMWISNTATTLMMLPIAASVVMLLVNEDARLNHKGTKNFATTIMLSIAYGASIGGIATLVGSPPNAAMAGILSGENFHTQVSFLDWMKLGLPFSIALLVLSYFLLVKILFPNRLGKFELGHDVIQQELRLLGKWKTQEKRIFILFVSTALLWIAQDPLGKILKPIGIEFSDVGVGIISASLLFIFPAGKKISEPLLEWRDTEKLPWGVLLMFGGGLALASGFKASGLEDVINLKMQSLNQANIFVLLTTLCFVGLVLTALMSNLAMVSLFVPIVAAIAISVGKAPELFAIPVTIAASCDFMFPMSTPPNAIAYSSGYVKATDMLRAGIFLNLLSFGLLALMVWLIL